MNQKSRTLGRTSVLRFRPWILITLPRAPDGVWHEQGRMGWWGTVIDGKETANWHTDAEAILRNYPDHSVVLIDAHV